MFEVSSLEEGVAHFLEPRTNLIWHKRGDPPSVWDRFYVIENAASRLFYASFIEQEAEERRIIRDQVETVLLKLSSEKRRSWMAEFDFMAKMLDVDQLIIFTPMLVQLAFLMPQKLKVYRRNAVRSYLQTRLPFTRPFILRQMRKFVRSSVLLYPASKLFEKADIFAALIRCSADQSARANKQRVVMSIRTLQIMTGDEITNFFKTEGRYLDELNFLEVQCRYYSMKAVDIYKIPAIDLRGYFWCVSSFR